MVHTSLAESSAPTGHRVTARLRPAMLPSLPDLLDRACRAFRQRSVTRYGTDPKQGKYLGEGAGHSITKQAQLTHSRSDHGHARRTGKGRAACRPGRRRPAGRGGPVAVLAAGAGGRRPRPGGGGRGRAGRRPGPVRGAPEVAAELAEAAVRLTPADQVEEVRRRRVAAGTTGSPPGRSAVAGRTWPQHSRPRRRGRRRRTCGSGWACCCSATETWPGR